MCGHHHRSRTRTILTSEILRGSGLLENDHAIESFERIDH
jgi:hypothetical protein